MKTIPKVVLLVSMLFCLNLRAYCPNYEHLLIFKYSNEVVYAPLKFYYSSLKYNNPFNIRTCVRNEWIGKVKENTGEFEKFTSLELGIRAGLKCLQRYQDRLTECTVTTIIHTLAPPHENDTDTYIKRVCQATGFGPHQRLDMRNKDTITRIAAEIVYYETGKPILLSQIENVFIKYFT